VEDVSAQADDDLIAERLTRWFQTFETLDPRFVALVFEGRYPIHEREIRSFLMKVPIEVIREVLQEREKQ
jgi:hypothetical protein